MSITCTPTKTGVKRVPWKRKTVEEGYSQRVFVVYEITVPTRHGDVVRQATGTEELEMSGYGDPTSNAESMAFRRACARFGLGLYLYGKD